MLEKKIKPKFDIGNMIYPLNYIQGYGDAPYQIIAITDNGYHVKGVSDFGEIDYFTIPFNDEHMFYTKKNNKMKTKIEDFDYVKSFKEISKEISDLYEKKNTAYGNSFADTYKRLGIISAVTRLSDKYNRLCNLVTNSNIDDLGESLEDTLKDLAAYSIMTLIELRK